MKNSHIEWTDHTFNPWIGCDRQSPACVYCYIERTPALRMRRMKLGDDRVRTSESYWKQPLSWNREARLAEEAHPGYPRPRVFCMSLGDWLDDHPSVQIEWLADLLKLIHNTPYLDWQLLTKRPQNWSDRLHKAFRADRTSGIDWVSGWLDGDEPANVWIGTTVEDQARADERIPKLLEIPARVRFLSCEPLLEELGKVCFHGGDYCESCDGTGFVHDYKACANSIHSAHINWVICGGESGPKARPMHPNWARSLRDQCQTAGVPFFFKQWGEWQPYMQGAAYTRGFQEAAIVKNGDGPTGWPVYRVGKKAAGRMLDGREWNEFPGLEVHA